MSGSLLTAARTGNLASVQQLIESGANVNETTSSGQTPLYIAATKGHLDIVNALLAAGANKDAATTIRATPLFVAAMDGHLAVVNALLAAGANKEAAVTNGTTPLYAAAIEGHTEIVNSLLAAGAEKDATAKNGTTPLYVAAEKGHIEIVNSLLAAGANKEAAAPNGSTPLYIAAEKGHVVVVNALLVSKASLKTPNFNGKSIEFHAREGRFSEPINRMILDVNNSSAEKWEGFTQSDIDKFNTIFDTTDAAGKRPPAENYATCPVCLQFLERKEACKYMKHNCSLTGGNYHEDLYKLYKNADGDIGWCTVCGRICDGHKHYMLAFHNTRPKPGLIEPLPGVDYFANTCLGKEGGGGLEEKLLRFRRLREYALALQDDIGKKSKKEAWNELVEETWNAPLVRIGTRKMEILRSKKWNIPTSEFMKNKKPVESEENTSNIPRPNANTLKPEIVDVSNNVNDSLMYPAGGKLIYFKHRTFMGEIVDHKERGEGIGKSALQTTIDTMRSDTTHRLFGMCPFECGAELYPDEVKDFITPESYEDYRKKFNKKKHEREEARGAGVGAQGAGVGAHTRRGGRRMTQKRRRQRGGAKNMFVEAVDAECVIVPKPGGGKTRRRRSARKTRKARL